MFTRQLRSSGCKIVIDLDSQDESVIHLDSQNESVIDLDSQNESEQENVAHTEKPPKKKKKLEFFNLLSSHFRHHFLTTDLTLETAVS